ncbi:uncharacterized protein LOC144762677 [Lissotriton helveticus]
MVQDRLPKMKYLKEMDRPTILRILDFCVTSYPDKMAFSCCCYLECSKKLSLLVRVQLCLPPPLAEGEGRQCSYWSKDWQCWKYFSSSSRARQYIVCISQTSLKYLQQPKRCCFSQCNSRMVQDRLPKMKYLKEMDRPTILRILDFCVTSYPDKMAFSCCCYLECSKILSLLMRVQLCLPPPLAEARIGAKTGSVGNTSPHPPERDNILCASLKPP